METTAGSAKLQPGHVMQHAGVLYIEAYELTPSTKAPTDSGCRTTALREWLGRRANAVMEWFGKMKGGLAKHPPSPPKFDMLLGGVGSFLGLLAIASLNARVNSGVNLPLLLGCFGASATLLFGMPSLPVAQPRNVFGGMAVSCVAGLFWRTMLGTYVMFAAPLGVAFSIVGMQLTATLHPPGGAAALIIAVMDPLQSLRPDITAGNDMGGNTSSWCIKTALESTFQERFIHGLVLTAATLLGSLILFVIALFTNNVGPSSKRYPTYWWS